ncbi:hypothetical protein TNCV_1063501 [Trichonephila clavipes]|nr:hypothetical protein TNCV_1063501 [Trichonephila clavipes]
MQRQAIVMACGPHCGSGRFMWAATLKGGLQQLSVQGIGSCRACHKFEPSTTKNPPSGGAIIDCRCRQLDTHRVQCIRAGGHHPSWHDRRASRSCQQPGQTSEGIPQNVMSGG